MIDHLSDLYLQAASGNAVVMCPEGVDFSGLTVAEILGGTGKRMIMR